MVINGRVALDYEVLSYTKTSCMPLLMPGRDSNGILLVKKFSAMYKIMIHA